MGALPEGYTPPKSGSNYMKLAQGANKFRIMSSIIVGWEAWLEEDGKRKPFRSKRKDELPKPGPDDRIKFFWAMVVWSYTDQQLQILEITQASIRKALEELEANEDWGDLRGYDITIKRDGEDLETTYSVIPSPKKTLDADIQKEWKESEIRLDALYTGENPFEPKSTELSDEELEDISNEIDKVSGKRKGPKDEVVIDPSDLPF
jgi:hypothetical protein